MENKEQLRFGQFRAETVNEEARTAEFVISTEAADTYGTVFMASGWDLSRYNSNPIVSYNHNDWGSDPDQIIGTSTVRLEDGSLIAVLKFEAAEDNPIAEKIFRKIKQGILRGASIRADVKEYHWGDFDKGENPDLLYFTRQELLAWSVVTVPSNPDALARNTEALEVIRSAIIKEQKQTPPEDGGLENKTLSRFEAQHILNKNLIEK